MRHQSENDDLHLEHSDPDDGWVGGELEVAEERPTTALSSDPGQRKWMLIGVAGCGLITAITVLLLTRDTEPAHAADQVEPEPPAIEQTVAPEPAPVVADPSTTTEPKPTPKPTLAATSPAATKPATASGPAAPPAPKTAPPPPAAPSSSSKPAPTPSKPAPTPSKPAPTQSEPAKPTPAPANVPALPADEQTSAGPAGDLPDVEGWDDADAAAERDETDGASTPAPSEPPSVEPEADAEAEA